MSSLYHIFWSKAWPVRIVRFDNELSMIRIDKLIILKEFLSFQTFARINIDIHCGCNIAVPKKILDHLDV